MCLRLELMNAMAMRKLHHAVTDGTLRLAQAIAAEIVVLYGSTFSPILKVLNDEIRRR